MEKKELGVMESRFADLVWEREPISTYDLVLLCEKEFKWKRSTTYTVLKRLSEGGIFENDNGTVRSVISRSGYYALRTESLVDKLFDGSLSKFIAAFTSVKPLSAEEADQIRKILDENEGK
ncbi:MAG: BlaI/MecI/CopY family transcriptional regulator [Eubacteriaceae bacterium]|nr:BlaI/MecI/CopY family transcriptional regulator [Eubacteriaceae bacterium]